MRYHLSEKVMDWAVKFINSEQLEVIDIKCPILFG